MDYAKKPDAETLQTDRSFKEILELDFSNMIPFVISNIRKGGMIPLFYAAINSLTLLFIVVYGIWMARIGMSGGGRILWQIAGGIFAGSLLIIPPHELIHGLAYRILGARKIKFGADLQQFIFYVTADRFPIRKGELALLALAPFVLINLVILVVTINWVPQIVLFSASLLLSHNIMCIGDFAILNYAYSQKGKLYTYDDVENKKSYFYVKEDPALGD